MHNLLLHVKLSIRMYFHGLHKFRAHQWVRSVELTTPMSLHIQMRFFPPALTSVIGELCKRDPTCYKERVLALRKPKIIPIFLHIALIVFMCYAVQEATVICHDCAVITYCDQEEVADDIVALVGSAHKHLFPYTLHSSEERRCCRQKGASSQKSDEIRLLDADEIFMQLSSSKCLWCPQILILVMKYSD